MTGLSMAMEPSSMASVIAASKEAKDCCTVSDRSSGAGSKPTIRSNISV